MSKSDINLPKTAFSMKANLPIREPDILEYWQLLFFVLIGGQIGNYLNLKILPTRFLALITSCLVIFVAIRMGLKII